MALNYAGIHLVAENYVNRPKSQQPYTSRMAETIHGASAYVISRKVENKYREQFEHLCASPHVVRIRDILNRSRAKFGTGEITGEADAEEGDAEDGGEEEAEGDEAAAAAPPAPRVLKKAAEAARAAEGGGGGGAGAALAKDVEGDEDDDEGGAAGGGGDEKADRVERLNATIATKGVNIKVIKGKGAGYQPAFIREGVAIGYKSAELTIEDLQTMLDGFTAVRASLTKKSKEYQDTSNYISAIKKEMGERK